jgi:RHS repeat-associated protein
VDYTVEEGEPPTIEEQMRYLAGFGIHAQQTVDGQTNPIRYLHGDLIRSTMLTTDETGSAGVSPAVAYTAFGDPVTPDGQGGWRIGFPAELATRYQYAGGWGYETGGFDGQSGILMLYGGNPGLPPITLQHVGARWYQPSTGRFVQRDPTGLGGGANVYAYSGNLPTNLVDPNGTRAWYWWFAGGVAGAMALGVELWYHHSAEEAAKRGAVKYIENLVRQDISTNDPQNFCTSTVQAGPNYPSVRYQRLGNGKVLVVVVYRDGHVVTYWINEDSPIGHRGG